MSGMTLFGKTRHPSIGKHISLVNKTQAEESRAWLNRQWEKSDRSRRVLLVQSANEAANRAKVGSENPNFSDHEHEQFREVEKVYRDWVDEHKGRE